MCTKRAAVASRAAWARTSSSTGICVWGIMPEDNMVRIALDAMGGDHAPLAPVAGAVSAARAWGYEMQLVGRESDVGTALRQQGDLNGIEHLLQIVHAPEVIEMGEHPASAVRSKRNSSMAVAVDLVKK